VSTVEPLGKSSSEFHAAPVPPPRPVERGLTPREILVAELIALGIGNKTIATRLGISPHTVGQHIRSALNKTGAQTRAELIARLYVAGCLDSSTWPPRAPAATSAFAS